VKRCRLPIFRSFPKLSRHTGSAATRDVHVQAVTSGLPCPIPNASQLAKEPEARPFTGFSLVQPKMSSRSLCT
jgi:hypothetical protein